MDLRLSWVTKCRIGADLRGIDWELGPEDIWEIYEKQNYVCALSGVDIGWDTVGQIHTASIDRIDSSKGYTIENVQLVHKDVNFMKQAFSQEHFISLCKKVANNND